MLPPHQNCSLNNHLGHTGKIPLSACTKENYFYNTFKVQIHTELQCMCLKVHTDGGQPAVITVRAYFETPAPMVYPPSLIRGGGINHLKKRQR